MKPLAWLVLTETEQRVVFATNPEHAVELGQAELGEIPCVAHRDERFDQYSPGPVPAKQLFHEHGWTLYCDGCGHGVWKEKAEVEDKTPVFVKDTVFCSKDCRVKFDRKMADTDHLFLQAFKEIQSCCPDAKLYRQWSTEDQIGTVEVFVQFSFPGAESMALWRSGAPTLIKLDKKDNEMWLDYKKSGRVH